MPQPEVCNGHRRQGKSMIVDQAIRSSTPSPQPGPPPKLLTRSTETSSLPADIALLTERGRAVMARSVASGRSVDQERCMAWPDSPGSAPRGLACMTARTSADELGARLTRCFAVADVRWRPRHENAAPEAEEQSRPSNLNLIVRVPHAVGPNRDCLPNL